VQTTNLTNNNSIIEFFNLLLQEDANSLKDIFTYILNTLMKVERSNFLQAAPYERTDDRIAYANGFKPKKVSTSMGQIEAQIPQVRGASFYPKALDKGSRSEVSLKLAIAEMYVQGVSTRRVSKITKELCGLEISSSQVSRLAKELDEKLELFRNRDLGEYPIIMFDARYEKVRHNGSVIDTAVLIAIGFNKKGGREILGVSTAMSEAEVHWRDFLESLIKRGLKGVKFITSDDHAGLKAARMAIFPSVPWQRCQFHMSQNAQHYSPNKPMRSEIAKIIKDIFNSRNVHEARDRVKEAITNYKDKAFEFTSWLENNIEEGLTVFQLPETLQKRVRTSNLMETINRQIKRRTRVASLFPNTDSCLRLVTAVVQEIHEDWVCGKKYIDMSNWFKE